MITPQCVKKFLRMMQPLDLDSKDVTLFNGWKVVFSQGISKCKYWILTLWNKLPKTRIDFHQQNFPNQAHLVLVLNVHMVKNGKKHTKTSRYCYLSCLGY